MHPVSVTVIALNEADGIAAAVSSVAWADEVMVLDSGSSDRTVEVARSAGARVVEEGWRGYGAQKNRAAELAAHDWVLSLDADERAGEDLARSVESLAADPPEAAFRVRRLNHFAGRPIRTWPWAWDLTARLYDRRRASFDERLVHETLRCEGRVGRLPGLLHHFSYRGWDDYLARQESYARLGAEEAAAHGRRPRAGDLTVRPAVTLFRHLLGRGYLVGGVLGFRLSVMAARGTRRKYAILRELSG